jgi:predicted lipoprotein with Yx(FWY)xxD motif
MKRFALVLTVAVTAVAATGALGSSKTVVRSGHTSLGSVLVNAKGLTLYLYGGDSASHLGCTGACTRTWPPLPGPATATGAAKASAIGTVKRGSGTQVTYDGHPLYTFAGDSKAGQTGGEGITLAGKKWYAVSPSGAAMTASSKGSSGSGSSGSGSSSSGGGSAGW